MKVEKSGREIVVISDIHGCYLELEQLIDQLNLKKLANPLIIFLGDYIDRGPDSKRVVEKIIDLKRYYEVVTLMGNHEKMLLDFLTKDSEELDSIFIYNGGGATLESYKNEKTQMYDIPKEHLDFFQNLLLYYKTENYFFVHAGVPDIAIDEINETDDADALLWIREDFYHSSFRWDKKIIHGHTPVKNIEFYGNRINIDTGCFYNNKLSALVLPENKIFSVENVSGKQHYYLKDEHSKRKSVRFSGRIRVEILKNDLIYTFETKNYSEHGMFITLINDPSGASKENTLCYFSEDEIMYGRLVGRENESCDFEGKVIRTENIEGRIYYAIQFIKGPYDFHVG